MNSRPMILVAVGLLMVIASVIMLVTGTAPKADAMLVAQCQARMSGQQAEMKSRCEDAAFATAMTATDASAAAHAISAANNTEIGGNALAMFLLGLGSVLTLGGIISLRRTTGSPDGR
jgi:hypothetical protein